MGKILGQDYDYAEETVLLEDGHVLGDVLKQVAVNVVVFVVFYAIGYAIGQYLFKPKPRTGADDLVDVLIDKTIKEDADAKV